jgi:hypothetical protein
MEYKKRNFSRSLVGQQLGNYRLLSLLGRGNFADHRHEVKNGCALGKEGCRSGEKGKRRCVKGCQAVHSRWPAGLVVPQDAPDKPQGVPQGKAGMQRRPWQVMDRDAGGGHKQEEAQVLSDGQGEVVWSRPPRRAHPLPHAQVRLRSLERRGRCLGAGRGWEGRAVPASIWAVVGWVLRGLSRQPDCIQPSREVSAVSRRSCCKPSMSPPASRRQTWAALTALCMGSCQQPKWMSHCWMTIAHSLA